MEELTRAKKKALFLLTDMDRTENELCEKLKKSGFSEETIAETLKYVKGFGYIDDQKYAVKYLEAYSGRRSRQRISYDLEKKGVSKEWIARAFDETEPYDERPLIKSLAMKKLRAMHPEDSKAAAKIAGSLARQGFRPSDIRSVLGELGLF